MPTMPRIEKRLQFVSARNVLTEMKILVTFSRLKSNIQWQVMMVQILLKWPRKAATEFIWERTPLTLLKKEETRTGKARWVRVYRAYCILIKSHSNLYKLLICLENSTDRFFFFAPNSIPNTFKKIRMGPKIDSNGSLFAIIKVEAKYACRFANGNCDTVLKKKKSIRHENVMWLNTYSGCKNTRSGLYTSRVFTGGLHITECLLIH